MSRPTPTATRGEIGLLSGITVLAAIAFTPLFDSIEIAGVALIAWLLWFTMIAAPVGGLILALRSKGD
ncbi:MULTISPECIES: hypothetical protein [Prauserella salsuginis group]|uniref:Uncharacterized protein n=2 Tax=Prauserella salsuginis group TaxID=2893672 RepID=A0A839XG74_9PSEU|nr:MULTISPECIES: hypothetical protein [Prauserella salsuginis group]MBB3661761.1 hypothetical protein [Prauserella sediminis]MCR3719672.1 hypothetical protein [Prauserella flava]MCR3735315.1 hypothetical protein [Prauserella salsuginis]